MGPGMFVHVTTDSPIGAIDCVHYQQHGLIESHMEQNLLQPFFGTSTDTLRVSVIHFLLITSLVSTGPQNVSQ